MTTSAAVFRGVDAGFTHKEFDTPSPRGEEVLVRVEGCTICGSDVHTATGKRSQPIPSVLGHEIVGRIEAFGEDVSRVDFTGRPMNVGDRIVWSVVASCGDCFYCQRDLPQKCERPVKYGHEALAPRRELTGGLATHCLLTPGTAVVRIDEDLPLAVACPAGCATSTIAAACEAAGELQGRTVCIAGVGMLGLTAAAMAKMLGAASVVCLDVQSARLELAQAFGADQCGSPGDVAQLIKETTGGYGFDVVLELSGARAANQSALEWLRVGGTLVLVGAVFPSGEVAWSPERLIRGQTTIRGVHNYAPRHLAQAVRFLAVAAGEYPFAEIVAEWLPLAAVERAFKNAADPANIRVGVRPSVVKN